MIIVKLMGGLGNQMFQYAAGRQIAEKQGVPLKMDLTFLQDRMPRENFTYRDYELGIFKVEESFATGEEIERFTKPKPKKILPKIVYKIEKALNPASYIREKSFRFDPSVLNAPANTYLDGFWQTEKYFADIQDILQAEFQFRQAPKGRIADLHKRIRSLPSVSIHLRRGDYVTNKAASDFHGLCSLDYYDRAIRYVLEQIPDAQFFIFSDEIVWAKENLKIDAPHFFVENEASMPAYEDMRLMNACKHHIIANSSFSWWAAWLNNGKDKIVVAPARWFKDPAIDTVDLIPESWIKM